MHQVRRRSSSSFPPLLTPLRPLLLLLLSSPSLFSPHPSPLHSTPLHSSPLLTGVPRLQLLDLSNNFIGVEGMGVIARCSKRTPELALHIHLHGNAAEGPPTLSSTAQHTASLREAEDEMQMHKLQHEQQRRRERVAEAGAAKPSFLNQPSLGKYGVTKQSVHAQRREDAAR